MAHMDFETLRRRIGSRRVVLDENMLMSNLRDYLNKNNIPWRSFRKGVTDEDIMAHLYPDEVVITADRRFAYVLEEQGILVPIAKSHLAQVEHLMKTIGRSRGGGGMWNDISTCPICTMNHDNLKEFTFWDISHMQRHVRRPYVAVKTSQ